MKKISAILLIAFGVSFVTAGILQDSLDMEVWKEIKREHDRGGGQAVVPGQPSTQAPSLEDAGLDTWLTLFSDHIDHCEDCKTISTSDAHEYRVTNFMDYDTASKTVSIKQAIDNLPINLTAHVDPFKEIGYDEFPEYAIQSSHEGLILKIPFVFFHGKLYNPSYDEIAQIVIWSYSKNPLDKRNHIVIDGKTYIKLTAYEYKRVDLPGAGCCEFEHAGKKLHFNKEIDPKAPLR